MASRPLIIASLVGASVGVPYVASQATKGTPPSNPFVSPSSTANVPQVANTAAIPISAVQYPTYSTQQPLAAPPLAPAQPVASYPIAPAQIRMLPPVTLPASAPGVATYAAAPTATPAPQVAPQLTSVSQVLRFDVTREWVCQTWPRKSTGPTDVGLFAIRVPLVTGTQMSALVGALTYYFNSQDQVEHISFRGRTGDTTQLVQYLTQSYQFKPVAAPTGERLFQVASGDAVYSELRLHPEAVLNSSLPQQSVAVELEFARPGSQRVLPPHAPTLQLPQADPSLITSTPPPPPPLLQTPPAAATNGAAPAAASNTGGYWSGVRYATPDEQTPMFDRRWPQ